MDLSGALLDEVILEVYDEEWVQAVNYEHIPFQCQNVMNMGTSSETAHSTKRRTPRKPTKEKTLKALPKWDEEGKQGGKVPKET